MKCCRRAKHQRMYTRAATADDDGTKYLPGGKSIKKVKTLKKMSEDNRNQAVASLGQYLSTKPGDTTCFSCFGHSVSSSLSHHMMLMFRPKITLFRRFWNYILLLHFGRLYTTPSKFNIKGNTFVQSFGKYLV